ncbi:MAG: nitrite reductase small subunit NirD [Betaproteobacteria bacterium]|nr:nitrite reductase small subunit NirD [Betaproteobacteria bacterium]
MERWIRVCRPEDIPRQGARVVQISGGADVAVFRTASDRIFAITDRCPHKGGPLSQGIVFGERVACPLHNWSVELDSGCASAPDEGCVRTFPVKVEAGEVMVDLARAPGTVRDALR